MSFNSQVKPQVRGRDNQVPPIGEHIINYLTFSVFVFACVCLCVYSCCLERTLPEGELAPVTPAGYGDPQSRPEVRGSFST